MRDGAQNNNVNPRAIFLRPSSLSHPDDRQPHPGVGLVWPHSWPWPHGSESASVMAPSGCLTSFSTRWVTKSVCRMLLGVIGLTRPRDKARCAIAQQSRITTHSTHEPCRTIVRVPYFWRPRVRCQVGAGGLETVLEWMPQQVPQLPQSYAHPTSTLTMRTRSLAGSGSRSSCGVAAHRCGDNAAICSACDGSFYDISYWQ